MLPWLHVQYDRHLNNAIRHPPIHPTPWGRRVAPPWRFRHEVRRLRLPVVDRERETKRARVSEPVQGGRDVRVDGDVPALMVGVEEIEVVFALVISRG